MFSSRAIRVWGIGLLVSLALSTQVYGQMWPPKRLPHCRLRGFKAHSVEPTGPVTQAAYVEPAVDRVDESTATTDEKLDGDSADPPLDELPEELPNPPAVLARPGWTPPPPPPRDGPGFAEYIIQAGDELEVKFRSQPKLNETLTVRPDGMITLQIVGDVMAAGRTPEELRHALMDAFRHTLKNPAIVVELKRFATNDVFVGGEVLLPGRIPISGQVTVLQAIILAGGFKDTANEKHVIVRREGGFSREINLKPAVRGHAGGQDMLLRPYDVIFVPKSPIAKVNLFMEQYIENVLPFSRNLGFFMTRELNAQNFNP